MNGAPIRLFELSGTPEQIGATHGSVAADEIKQYTADRVERSADGTRLSADQILSLAGEMLAAHEEYDPRLFREMLSLAEAADISAAEAVIVGGYTDFIDTVRAVAHGGTVEDNCSAMLVSDERAGGAGFLAQTWDMHASATPHVVMLRIEPDIGPRALVFTTVGTLGQIGMNEAGIAIGINNLTADDGGIGVTWPFVVRKALAQTSFDAAVACVLDAPLAGGHNFLIIDRDGRGCSIEAMPTAKHVVEVAADVVVHTNHCLVAATQAVEGSRPGPLQASSVGRLEDAAKLARSRVVTVEAAMEITRDQRSICRHPEPPFDYESCGAAIMRPATGDFWACWGVPSENEYEHFSVMAGAS